jgi:serine/threonine protein kinase
MPTPPDPAAAGQPPQPVARFRDTAIASGLLSAEQIAACEADIAKGLGPAEGVEPSTWDAAVADALVRREMLTKFQAQQLLAGRRKLTLGQYTIVDEIGHGGMGQVFRARHTLMGRTVAIKVLPRSKSNSDTEAAFQREIRMLARLDHDNLVRALDAGHDGKVYYLVTEMVPGLDLRRQVLKHGRLDEAAAASVITQAARGLAYAHGQGLVHRDVKPANLLVTPEGLVKVLDLGLAGSALEEEGTRLGRVVGTMDYMAPEQIRSPDTVSPTADVYALGCTAYFAVTGQVPFPGGSRQEKATRQLTAHPRPIRELEPKISEAFVKVVEAMMRKDPRERPPTAGGVIERLAPLTPAQPVPMSRVTLPRPEGARAGATHAARSAAAVATGSSVEQGSGDVSVGASHPTPGLFSAGEETRRDLLAWSGSRNLLVPAGTVSTSPPSGGDAGESAADAARDGWAIPWEAVRWLLLRVMLAAAAGGVFAAIMRRISRIHPPTAEGLLGKDGFVTLGWVVFAIVLVGQLAFARGRPGPEGIDRSPPS